MGIKSLQSGFGKAARRVTLAVAMLAPGGLTAQAQESLPDSCLAANDLNRADNALRPVLKTFADNLKAYSGWPALDEKMNKAGIGIDRYCGAVYPLNAQRPPVHYTRTAENVGSLDINLSAIQVGDDGKPALDARGEPAVGMAPPSMLADHMDEFMANAVRGLSLAIAQGNRPMMIPADDLDTTVLIRTVVQANAAAESVLLGLDVLERTGSDNTLNAAWNAIGLPSLRQEVLRPWRNAMPGQGKKPVFMTAVEKESFRRDLILLALKDPDTRRTLYKENMNMILTLAAQGIDPRENFNTRPPASELSDRLAVLGPAVAQIDIAAIGTALLARPDDPSKLANATVNTALGRYRDILNRREGKGPVFAPRP